MNCQKPLGQNKAAKIMLVDDHPMMRKSLRNLIALEEDMIVVAEANNGREALSLMDQSELDLIILDNHMPELNGIETLKQLREMSFAGKILLFTVSDSSEDVSDALKYGVDGYLLKDIEPDDLIEKLRKILGDELVVSSSLAPVLAKAMSTKESKAEKDDTLSPRELEVITMISEGNSNKMIGNKLGITESTVKVHVKSILSKLGLRTRVEAAVWVINNLQ